MQIIIHIRLLANKLYFLKTKFFRILDGIFNTEITHGQRVKQSTKYVAPNQYHKNMFSHTQNVFNFLMMFKLNKKNQP